MTSALAKHTVEAEADEQGYQGKDDDSSQNDSVRNGTIQSPT